MNEKKRDKYIEKMLCYFKSEIDKTGLSINNVWFDLTPSKVQKYLNAPDEIIPDTNDLIELKSAIKIKNEDLDVILKYCSSNGYIGTPLRINHIQLTDDGYAYAKCSEQARLNKKFPTWLKDILIAVTSSVITAIILTIINNYWRLNG